ncbi:hypothetical protein GAYE_HTGSCF31FUTG100G0354 [Galdieria yellowstonensis]|uniref:Uncharacterized protein n=1 Tax=Galdieria yellowstonensis TaxID=3028027 RepID=A0AAV9I2K4_9RHOD|nr:hypothetical protein GAYE_HTGSCF31FUTG100G0354 [Galdieria yellowstonensis]
MTSTKRDTFIPPADSSMSPRVRNQEISSNSTEQRENSEGEKSSPRRSYSGKFLQHVNEVANAAIAPIKSAFEFLTNTAVSGLIVTTSWRENGNKEPSKTNPQSFVRRSTGAIHKDKKLDTLLSPRSTSEQAHPISASNLEESDEEDDNMSYYTCADTPGLDGKTAARPSFAADSEIFEETSEVWNEPGEQPSTEHDTKNSKPKETIPERQSTELNKNALRNEALLRKKRFHRYVSFSAAHEDFVEEAVIKKPLAEAASQPGFEMASVSTLRKQALQNDHESTTWRRFVYPSSLQNVLGHYQDRRLASYPNDAEPVTPDGYRVKDEFLDETGPQNMSFFKIVREVFKDVRKGGDLTSISVPASLLEPVSACEKVTRIMQRGELLQEIDSLKRNFQKSHIIPF